MIVSLTPKTSLSPFGPQIRNPRATGSEFHHSKHLQRTRSLPIFNGSSPVWARTEEPSIIQSVGGHTPNREHLIDLAGPIPSKDAAYRARTLSIDTYAWSSGGNGYREVLITTLHAVDSDTGKIKSVKSTRSDKFAAPPLLGKPFLK